MGNVSSIIIHDLADRSSCTNWTTQLLGGHRPVLTHPKNGMSHDLVPIIPPRMVEHEELF